MDRPIYRSQWSPARWRLGVKIGAAGAAIFVVISLAVKLTAARVFFVEPDGRSAERRRIKVGRRTSEPLEILSCLVAGERVITSDCTGFNKVDRIVLKH
jgi:multidrug efflux pump subunit AcrA (membrane-fusion protein)